MLNVVRDICFAANVSTLGMTCRTLRIVSQKPVRSNSAVDKFVAN